MGEPVQSNGHCGNHKQPLPDSYDEMPYISMPIGYTHPARLAAVACMYGIEVAPPDEAVILEIGCAAGGNIIPLAARYPNASFHGLDLSSGHVARAKQRIDALGLHNIKIRQGNIATAVLPENGFDYIICHGVFSWVPAEAQDAIFRICRDCLSPRGLAAISYNVLPGWHQRRVVRDLCLAHSKAESSAQARVAKAREIIAEIAAIASPNNPYGFLLRTEAERLKTLPSSYILGEFLATDNTPFTFHDFTTRCTRFGLGYISECDLASTYPETFVANAAARIRKLAKGDANALQTYIDIFSGRTFRRSLVARQTAAASARPPVAERMTGLHISCFLKRAGAGASEASFKDRHGRTISAPAPYGQGVLAALGKAYPDALPVEDLLATAPNTAARKMLAGALFELVLGGSATVSALPFSAARANAQMPRVSRLARIEASAGQPWVTSPLHAGLALNPVLSMMLPVMDGTRSRTELQNAVAAALKAGQLGPAGKKAATTPAPANNDVLAADYVQRGLAYLAINGMLEIGPEPAPQQPTHASEAAVAVPPRKSLEQRQNPAVSRKNKRRKR